MNPQPTITILPELEAFIPEMMPSERKNLEDAIVAEGRAIEALIVWRKDELLILVDGHNRLDICRKYGLPYTVREKDFANIGEVMAFMVAHQKGRRNTTELQNVMIIGAHYETEKGNALDNLQHRQGTTKEKEEYASNNTAHRLAKHYNLSGETAVKRYAKAYIALKKIEAINPNAVRIIYQLIRQKYEMVIDISFAPEALIQAIAGEATMKEAQKVGKAQRKIAEATKKPKVQNKLSGEKREATQQATDSELQKVKHKAQNLERENEKHRKTIEQLQNRLKKQETALPAQKEATASLKFYQTMRNGKPDSYYIVGSSGVFYLTMTYPFGKESTHGTLGLYDIMFSDNDGATHKLTDKTWGVFMETQKKCFDFLSFVEKRFEELPQMLQCFFALNECVEAKKPQNPLKNWQTQCETLKETLSDLARNTLLDALPEKLREYRDNAIDVANHIHFLENGVIPENSPKVQNELSTSIETDLEVIKRKYRELQEAGFTIYNVSETEMCIKVMNSAGEWESPEELKFKTKSATGKKFDELKRGKAIHASLEERALEDWSIHFYYFKGLQNAGFKIYRDSISEMRIKLMNENGSWTSPKELQFSTQEEAQAKWRELMMQPKTLSN